MRCKMKQLFVLFLLSLCTVAASAQDVIVKKDGSTIVCRIVDVGSTVVVYKKWTDLKGDSQMINLSDISAINYENGKKEDYSEANNLYTPNNQNNGIQQYNDRALLQIDAASKKYRGKSKKAKTLRLTGLIGGVALVGAGLVVWTCNEEQYYYKTTRMIGGIMIGCGVVGATTLCIIANHCQRQYNKYEQLQASAIFQQDFKLKDGTVLTPSIDMYDVCRNSRGLGVGLSYKF